MGLTTSCIGAYPKPEYITLPDWFNLPAGPEVSEPTRRWQQALTDMGPDAGATTARAIREVIADQVDAGIDIPTDGEVMRENYVHYHCRHLTGFDFDHLTETAARCGSYTTSLPTVTGPVAVREMFLKRDWTAAQTCTDRPVKVTMPGPMTVSDTSADNFYGDPAQLGADVAAALNYEVRELERAGCRHIQIDEPLFARKPQEALDYGFENIERAFHRCSKSVTRTVHMCCGYPDRIDHPDYPKADPASYQALADAIEYSSINAISLEDAHRHNDLSLLEKFPTTTVIFGAVAIAQSRIESVEEIRDRLRAALDHIDAHRLIAAPDCGLGILTREQAVAKLTNLCKAARSV